MVTAQLPEGWEKLSIIKCFEKMVHHFPETTAVVCGDLRISYVFLDAMAEKIARSLLLRGLRPEEPVGLCFDRDIYLVAGMLGILKAGAAYLPLDNSWPHHRKMQIIQDAGLRFLISNRCSEFSGSGITTLSIEKIIEESVTDNGFVDFPEVYPENLAYILYTSGTTGNPKGVMIEHASVLNYIHAFGELAPISAPFNGSCICPVVFDVSVWEIFSVLCTGGTLHLLQTDHILNIPSFVQYFIKYNIQSAYISPGMLSDLADAFKIKSPQFPIQRMLVGVESILQGSLQKFRNLSASIRIINGYGPTEATISCTFFVFNTSENPQLKTPIGQAINGYQIYIVSSDFYPVDSGKKGEILVGGKGLARAYLNDAGLTAQKFIVSQIPGSEGQRLYRTGDMGWEMADGNIVFEGRIDNQLKIRGYRVEPGDVEAALLNCDGIKECYVGGRDDSSGETSLYAWIVSSTFEHIIREQLAGKLPPYMLPQAFVYLDALPRTSAGKVDHSSLIIPDLPGNKVDENFNNEEERLLAAIWKEVFGLSSIGRDDDFFAIGGHSIKAAQIAARLGVLYQKNVPVGFVFDHPTISGMHRAIEELSDSEADIRIGVKPEEVIPVSYNQQRPWIIDRLQGQNAFYNIPMVLRLLGILNRPNLEAAIDAVFRKHESLRTSLVEVEGQPRQIVRDDARPLLRYIEPINEIDEIIHREVSAPFNLSSAPLARLTLCRLSAEEHYLIMVFHHSIMDGWSFGLMLEEISRFYNLLNSGIRGIEFNLSGQYSEFTLREEAWFSLPENKKELNVWNEITENVPPLLALGKSALRPPEFSYKGASMSFYFDETETERINSLAKNTGSSPFMVLLSALSVIMKIYSGEKEFLLATMAANRQYPEDESIIGFYTNTLLMRMDLGGNPDLNEIIHRTKDSVLRSFRYQHHPYELVVEQLKPERNLAFNPLYQVMLIFQNMPIDLLQFDGIKVSEVEFERNKAKIDLTITFDTLNGRLRGLIEYSTDIFDKEMMERLVEHYHLMIHRMADSSKLRLNDISLLTPDDKEKLARWSCNETEFTGDIDVVQMFEAMASMHPDRTAIESDNKTMTYEELRQRIHSISAGLEKQDITAGSRIAVLCHRNADTIAAYFAILKSACVFIPVDPGYPAQRINDICDDASVDAILITTLTDTSAFNPSLNFIKTYDIITGKKISPASIVKPSHPAYIIYTSGSTGKPKGVLISRGALGNFVRATIFNFFLQPSDRVMQFAALTFDTSMEEIFPTLCSGAALILRNDDVLASFSLFLNWCEEKKISVMDLPTAYWHNLVSLMKDQSLSFYDELKLVIVGGEEARAIQVKYFMEISGKKVRLLNTYGPTEATVVASVYEFEKEFNRTIAPIGKPMPNVVLAVVDSALCEVLPGSPGELLIGGTCLADMYINQSELTKEKFIRVFIHGEYRRMYRTGDVVQYLPNGNLIFLGRNDTQIKIRGYRIEPGEVENLLIKYPGIKDARVLGLTNPSGQVVLMAYLVSKDEIIGSQVLLYLREHLPEYMVPVNVVVMDEFPLTAHGKINLKALPAPDFYIRSFDSQKDLPAAGHQTELSKLWQSVLKINNIYIDDNFFDIGGNSILATLLMTKVNYQFKIQYPLAGFFRWPTIRGMDNYLASARYENPGVIQPITRSNQTNDIPASFTQRRIWFLDRLEGSNAAYNIPFSYAINGPLNFHLLQKAIEIIIQSHSIMRACIIDGKNGPLLKIQDSIDFELKFQSLHNVDDNEKESAIKMLEKTHSLHVFELAKAPLFMIDLIELKDNTYQLLLNFHHVISDNWAVGVFIRELSEIYEILSKGQIPDKKTPSIQYSDFALWQYQRVESGDFNYQLDFWLEHLKFAREAIQLPLDRPRKSSQTFNGAECKILIPIDLEEKLQSIARKNNATLYNVLLTAWAILLSRYSLQENLVIGCPVANRHHPGTQDMMGVFVNNLPLHIHINREASFTENLIKVSDLFINALQNQDIPFDLIVSKLNIKRNINIHPVFQVMFNLLNAHGDTPSFPNCKVDYIDPGRFVSKFDLSLILARMEEALVGVFEYNTDLFHYRSIRNMASYFLQLLSAIADNPDCASGKYKLLKPEEEISLLKKVNPEPLPLPPYCYPRLFEECATANGEKIAVRYKERSLTYFQLLQSAKKIASYLILSGVKPGDTVGLWLSRSELIPVAMIGAQLSGAIYVPLDPIYPTERVQFMIKDSGLSLLITDDVLINELPTVSIPFVNVNEALLFNGVEQKFPLLEHHHQVYTIYTSGSTGKPKGVEILHGGLVNFLLAMKKRPGILPEDILLAITTLSFDISVLEIYLPLIAGATIVIASQEEAMDASRLMDAIDKSGATILQATPVTWRMLTLSKWQGNKRLKALCGGEALLKDLSSQLLGKCGEVWNVYGPTEITVWATTHHVLPGNLTDGTEPLGFPIDNTYVYVFEPGMVLAPPGLPGELFIGGAGIAMSYKGRPILTAEKFVKDIFRDDDGSRMYATGDLVRMHSDGNLSFLGRIDNQVKIRGFRIELGEIESIISSFEEVVQCVAIVREDMPNNLRIVAYIHMNEGSIADRLEMRKRLIHLLPEYMIPSAFVVMKEFPLTPSGKINRKALPEPEANRDGIKAEFVEPDGETEIRLAELWCDVLKLEKVSVHDDFFAMGGHSLLGVNLFAKVEHHLKKRLPLASLFTHSSLRQMAGLIDDDKEGPDWSSLVHIKPFGSKIPLFLVHGAGLNVVLYNSLVKNMSPEQPVYGLQAKGLDGKEEPLKTMEEIAAHYISEIRKEYPSGPVALAGFSLGGIVAFEMTRQMNADSEQVIFLGMFDTVAHTSDKHLTENEKNIRKIKIFINQILFNIGAFIKEPVQEKSKLLGWKINSIKRRIRSVIYRRKAKQAYMTGDKEKLPSYVYRVHELNNLAGENYLLKPSKLKIDLFRAQHQTFYIIDKKMYGWDKFALDGVRVHHVPGEHSTIFWPPYDEAFSKKLQKGVDEAAMAYMRKFEEKDD